MRPKGFPAGEVPDPPGGATAPPHTAEAWAGCRTAVGPRLGRGFRGALGFGRPGARARPRGGGMGSKTQTACPHPARVSPPPTGTRNRPQRRPLRGADLRQLLREAGSCLPPPLTREIGDAGKQRAGCRPPRQQAGSRRPAHRSAVSEPRRPRRPLGAARHPSHSRAAPPTTEQPPHGRPRSQCTQRPSPGAARAGWGRSCGGTERARPGEAQGERGGRGRDGSSR